MYTGYLHALYLAAYHVEYARCLETFGFFLIDIEHAAQLKAVQSGSIASNYIDGKFIDHLSIHMAMSTQSGHDGILERFVCKEALQVDTLHTLFGREKEFAQPCFVHPDIYGRQVDRLGRADGDGRHFLVNARMYSKGSIAVKVFTHGDSGNVSFSAF